jgi:tetratricopeptide (TPR) repeat protein
MSHLVTDAPAADPQVTPAWAEPADDPNPGIRRLHSAAMMAELLGVPPAAVRHWIRTGLLAVAHCSASIEWLDFGQLVVGRQLARLLAAGLSLREIDSQLAGFARQEAVAAVARGRVVADGRRLSILQDGRLLGPGGQLQFAFSSGPPGLVPNDGEGGDAPAIVELVDRGGAAASRLPTPVGRPADPADHSPGEGDLVAEILDLADDLEAAGEYAEAAEALRAVLQAQGPSAEVNFNLAELLYRAGDLTAARERYYAAIELDGDHLRARASLGCLLAELGEAELALAALEGVLRQEPDYAEAHWHVAGVLATLGRPADARRHLRRFLVLAPESPWAALARERLT